MKFPILFLYLVIPRNIYSYKSLTLNNVGNIELKTRKKITIYIFIHKYKTKIIKIIELVFLFILFFLDSICSFEY